MIYVRLAIDISTAYIDFMSELIIEISTVYINLTSDIVIGIFTAYWFTLDLVIGISMAK